MEIIKFKKKKNNLYEIILDNKTNLNLYDDVIIKYNLLVNKKFDNKKLEEILAYNNLLDAYNKALKYLTFKMRTKKELETYLIKNNFSLNIINEIIERLEKEKYLNDDAYIKAYINDQINLTLKGPNLIKKDLNKKGFKDNKLAYIDTFTNDIWLDKINKIINKKIKSNHTLSEKMFKIKIKQYLIKEGFSLNLVNNCLDDLKIDNNNDILEKEFNKELRKLSKKYQDRELELKIKNNLYRKGFELSNIEEILANYKEK